MQAYARRLTEVNPVLNCIVEARIAAALDDADAVDRLVASGEKTPQQMEQETPFLGVPFTVKESCSVKGQSRFSPFLIYTLKNICLNRRRFLLQLNQQPKGLIGIKYKKEQFLVQIYI